MTAQVTSHREILYLSTCVQFNSHVYFSHYLLITFFKNINQLVTLKSDSMYLPLPCFLVILCCCIQSLKCVPLMKVLEAISYFNSCDKYKNRCVMSFLEQICRVAVNICISIAYYVSCNSTFSKH